MNVTELARKLKITPNKLKEIMPQLGFDIGARAIKVDPKMAQAIIEKMSDPAVREKYLNEGEPMTKRETAREEKKQEGEVGIIKVPEKIVVKELARRMNIPVANLILELMKNGVMAPLNQYIDFETASIIAEDMGFGVEKSEESDLEIDNEAEQRKLLAIDQDSASPRPPIVVVMGHVDHGKTKLLDAIRNTNIMEGEAGGITQHIGAYQVERGGRLLTFIDTPGHEAFSAMRSRGAKVADIAILLAAADDGVQPQTIEALAHIRKAELPFIVAINKIDKPGANIEKVKGDLANIGLAPEDWGGKTICVEISAKENINISLLLENLFLVADLNKEKIVANISVAAAGTIIESHIDKGEGPVATVLIQNGTLMGGDLVKIGNVVGKIRIMKNWKGEQIEKATPSMPVRILGLKAIPRVGDILQVVENQKELKKLSKIKISEPQRVVSNTFNSRDKNNEEENEKPKVNIILKSDVLGSVEAIIESLLKIEKGGVSVAVIKQGLGNITEKDIEQAAALGAEVLGFNVKITPEAKKMSTDKGVEAVVSGGIYDLLDFVEKKVIDLAGVEIIEKVVGRLKVMAIFRTEKREQIIGGKVESGRAVPEIQARVFRKNQLVGEIKIKEVEAGRTKVKEVLEGEECGMRIESKIEIEKNDVLELFTREEKKRYGQS